MQQASRSDLINKIKTATDLAFLAAEFGIVLKRQGRELSGLCPFHDEKSPSFFVNTGKQVYLCRGCRATGDAVHFAAEMRGTTDGEALVWLGERVGIELPSADAAAAGRQKKKRSLNGSGVEPHIVLDRAARFYIEALHCHESAMEVARARGLDESCMRGFAIGYAPHENTLMTYLEQNIEAPRQAIVQVAEEAGLFRKDGRKPLLRNRIVFPITDMRGHVCGFAGRRIDESDDPKYLNSPESNYFRKRQVLYGLTPWNEISTDDRALWRTRLKQDDVFVVEGYTDVLALARAGLFAVASMGTAFTEDHLTALRRRGHRRIAFCFDGDKAGRNAAIRTVNQLIVQVRDDEAVRFVTLPSSLDPDDFISAHGRQAFDELPGMTLGELWLDSLFASHRNPDSPESAVAVHAALDAIAPKMKAPMLLGALRAAVAGRAGPHPLRGGGCPWPAAPRVVHPLVCGLIKALLKQPDELLQLEWPSPAHDRWIQDRLAYGYERCLPGLNLLLLARQLLGMTSDPVPANAWDLIMMLQDRDYPATWAGAMIEAANNSSLEIGDIKSTWSELLRLCEAQHRVGLIWTLSQ